jgi:hypothetical protein
VFVRLDHIPSVIINADHGIVRTATSNAIGYL